MTDAARSLIVEGLAVDHLGPSDGLVVVLLHGGGQTRHSWSQTAGRLADLGYCVVNYDARGHGDSDWALNGRYTLESRAKDLRTVIDGVGAPFALIGASLGGATAIHTVAEGLRPAALVLVDIAPNAEPAGVARVVRFMRSGDTGFATLEEAADAVAAYYPERERPADSQGLYRNLRRRADGRLYWHWDPAILDDQAGILGATLETSSRKLATVPGVATLLVRGLRSDVVSEATVTLFRDILPRLEILDVAGAGHMVAGDRNDIFTHGIGDFLDRQRTWTPSRGHADVGTH